MDIRPTIFLNGVDIYQQDKLILSQVQLHINEGEWVYLIGKVGSGKSSLMKILYAELESFTGQASILGYSLGNIKQSEIPALRRKLGIVFQDFRLLTDRNVHDNLSFVLKATGWKDEKAIESRIQEVIEKVGMVGELNSMPHELSGGEQQRVVVARALLNDPEIILADEPTGNLDPDTSEELMEIFKEINSQGKTILMATHDYVVLNKYASRTLVCADQKVSDPESSSENIDFKDLLKE